MIPAPRSSFAPGPTKSGFGLTQGYTPVALGTGFGFGLGAPGGTSAIAGKELDEKIAKMVEEEVKRRMEAIEQARGVVESSAAAVSESETVAPIVVEEEDEDETGDVLEEGEDASNDAAASPPPPPEKEHEEQQIRTRLEDLEERM